eukprot:403350146
MSHATSHGNSTEKDKKNSGNMVAESKSLWNYALSPGWTPQEVDVLKIALMKFGIGKWTIIDKSGILPTKTIQQCYLQTQRILGQQSLAEFMGLHVDIDKIALDNRRKNGIRKMGFLVNQGGKLTPEEKAHYQEINRQKYGLSPEEVETIKLPPPCSVEIYDINKIINPKSKLTTIEKINHCIKLQDALLEKLENIKNKKIPTGAGFSSSRVYENMRGYDPQLLLNSHVTGQLDHSMQDLTIDERYSDLDEEEDPLAMASIIDSQATPQPQKIKSSVPNKASTTPSAKEMNQIKDIIDSVIAENSAQQSKNLAQEKPKLKFSLVKATESNLLQSAAQNSDDVVMEEDSKLQHIETFSTVTQTATDQSNSQSKSQNNIASDSLKDSLEQNDLSKSLTDSLEMQQYSAEKKLNQAPMSKNSDKPKKKRLNKRKLPSDDEFETL